MNSAEYIKRLRLQALLDSWWIDNGWSPATLACMPTYQLAAIYNKAVMSNWPIKTKKSKEESQQLSFQF